MKKDAGDLKCSRKVLYASLPLCTPHNLRTVCKTSEKTRWEVWRSEKAHLLYRTIYVKVHYKPLFHSISALTIIGYTDHRISVCVHWSYSNQTKSMVSHHRQDTPFPAHCLEYIRCQNVFNHYTLQVVGALYNKIIFQVTIFGSLL